MKPAKVFCTFLVLLLLPFAIAAEAKRVNDFALLDNNGRFHKLSSLANRDAVVIFMQGNGCDISRAASAQLSAIKNQFSENKLEIFMLNARAEDDRDAIIAEAKKHNISFPVLIDDTQLVAEDLGATQTGEVFVINPAKQELVYRGPISAKVGGSEKNYLQQALSSLIAGEEIALAPPAVKGDKLNFYRREQHTRNVPSYQDDIVPILEERCVACHQDGGLAPWAMNSHAMVKGFSPMMRETIVTKRMPPGQIDNFNREQFNDVHYISVEEQTKLIHWIDAGSPKQGDRDPLTELDLAAPEWEFGEPDLIVDIPPQEIPATGTLDYLYIPIELNLPEDKWVRAYEYNIGQKQVLHHIIAYTADKSNPTQRRQLMGGYGPGKPPTKFAENVGFLLTPDTNFLMEIHYTTSGRATVDHTKLALYFADEPPALQIRNDAAVNPRFKIPPYEQDYALSASMTVPEDSYLYSFSPHMHFRGARMAYTAVYPDGKRELLLNIPNYRFDWQMDYRLKERKFLPKGTTIIADGAFDNSEMNTFNPDPSAEVTWGEQTWQEMFIGFVGLAYVGNEAEAESTE